ncbi:unnamed protein product [Medioppia subpectinata]|uniref:HMG box domain-containing protein n=1 Tax=Medioppia subpectinata TaxID=1979941 RepID=A0A7R9L2F5_9ACAR|nr:unnamed protein product [Medioppia subpectinata]CAG2113161.1 unnamed protein product [Medioppia subpectinata]
MANNDSNEEYMESDKRKSTVGAAKRRASADGPAKGSGAQKGGDKGSATGGDGGGGNAAKKHKRGKQMRDQNAPRAPLNGYVRYLNSNRERAKAANPGLSFADITKVLAAEWTAMSADQKRHYLDEAERAKEVYMKELQEYQRTEAYQEFQQKQRQRKEQKQQLKAAAAAAAAGGSGGQSSGGANSGNASNAAAGAGGRHGSNSNADENQELMMETMNSGSTLDLPIFTEEFLDHNRVRESELRSLRKLNTEYEEQNAILSKHIDNMKSAIEKLEVEAVQQRTNNQTLSQHIQHVRQVLVKAFAAVAIPGTAETPTADTIDDYMVRLHGKLTAKERNRDTESVADRVRGIVATIDYSFH